MLTFINTQSPHSGESARNALDMIMMAVSLDQPVQVLFQNDGVFQLLQQQTQAIEQKNPLVKYRVLTEIFELDTLYVCAESLNARHLTAKNLSVPAIALDSAEINTLLNNSTKVVRF